MTSGRSATGNEQSGSGPETSRIPDEVCESNRNTGLHELATTSSTPTDNEEVQPQYGPSDWCTKLVSLPDLQTMLRGFYIALHAVLVLLRAGRAVDPLPENAPSLVEQNPTSRSTDEETRLSSSRLLYGDLADLQEAIRISQEMVRPTSPLDDSYHTRLGNLGAMLLYRFNRLGELGDLDDGISRQQDAVAFTPHDHPDRPTILKNLGNSFITRFQRFGQLGDLEEAISRYRDADDLTPRGHPDKPGYLNNLGASLLIRFTRLGQMSDLRDAISMQRDAVDHTPDSHPDKSSRLCNLGSSFLARFARLGQMSDLEDAISVQRSAVDLTPQVHPHKPSHLSNLGSSFLIRFQRLGQLSDLEDGISRQRDAVDLTPHGDPLMPRHLNNLGKSLFTRFVWLGQPNDIEDAISMQRTAIDVTPDGHPDKPGRLNNLGASLFTRFERFGQPSDLEDAISSQKDAVDLTPDNHPDKPSRLCNLGISLSARFAHLCQANDLEDAISRQRDAVNLTPHDYPLKPGFLYNLGRSFFTRFKRSGELCDLEDAISQFKSAVELIPHGHASKATCLIGLGQSFETRFDYLGEFSDLEDAIFLYLRAASDFSSPTRTRFNASQIWISCARCTHHHSLLHAYSVAINLLPQLAWTGHTLSHRYSELARGAEVVREAAAAALELGFPETAVEWLEQGRSIVWGDLFQLRSSFDELLSDYQDHARRLRELSVALDHASATHERSLSLLSECPQSTTASLQDEADKHRKLAIERDKLLQEIRKLPGFERFLLQKEFSQLRASAHSGPVVILNAAKGRCDALIVVADMDHAIHIPLPDFTFQQSIYLQNTLNGFLRHAREGRPEPLVGADWESLLSPLWKCVAKPVLDVLAFSVPGNFSRIFWCPTGPFMFLPIHAAGLYDTTCSLKPGNRVFDFIVSSYTPTLSILIPSPKPNTALISNLCLLSVRQPPSDGLPQLQGVVTELGRLIEVIKNSPTACVTLLESSTGTVEEVLGLMKEADWVHFACHGTQDTADPASSGLCLADERRLKISDIIALSRPRGGLAFLSACETAKGDKHLSDEAIHIAAGMMFAGYGGVIGTMWSISDRLAPDVASDVYEYLFRDGKRPDYREAARALHEATQCARDNGESFIDWAPFIHVGL